MPQLNKRIAEIGIPPQMSHLRISPEGYPVPWFVQWVNEEPDFRAFNAEKFRLAYTFDRCWLCGGKLGRYKTFVIGPMCMINKINGEPPSHRDCARYAAIACPFLTQPRMRRNEKDVEFMHRQTAGIAIGRNPGVAVLWTTYSYKLQRLPNGILFELGKPEHVEFYANGRPATRDEVLVSIVTGLPLLREADNHDPEAMRMIDQRVEEAMRLLPVEAA